MVLLSAQPDEYYFYWQLELQLLNFRQCGIPPQQIHILIGHHPVAGPHPLFSMLQSAHAGYAQIFFYPDNRTNKVYAPSIRPHIIRQHLEKFPELQQEAIFYHDSDILFREQPNWNKLLAGDTWYVSDTRSYLDSQFIRKKGDEEMFAGMCTVAGIPEELVIAGDSHCGGAQYMLKNTTPLFWEKIEERSNSLFTFISSANDRQAEKLLAEGLPKSSYKGLSPWCADMWALYWYALLLGKSVEISPEIDFCCATDNIAEWYRKKILHYTGDLEKADARFFKKIIYARFPPFHDPRIAHITADNCSYPLLELIREYQRQQKHRHQTRLHNVTFIIITQPDPDGHFTQLMAALRYLDHHFDADILLAVPPGADIDSSLLPVSCHCVSLPECCMPLNTAQTTNYLAARATTPIVALYDTSTITPVSQIMAAVAAITAGHADVAIAHNGEALQTDRIFQQLYAKLPDDGILLQNRGKFPVRSKRYLGGCVLADREKYTHAGMENILLYNRDLRVRERIRRFRNIGLRIHHTTGPAFILPHAPEAEEAVQDLEAYLQVCRMTKQDTLQYIDSWASSFTQRSNTVA